MASFKVTGKLNLDGSNFQAGMTRAQAAVKGLGGTALSSLKGQLAAAFSVGAVTMLAKKTLDYADSIDETASRLGVGVEQLQEWTFAAKQAGSNTEELTQFIEKLTQAAVDPSKQGIFAKMGISPEGMTTGGLFQSVAGFAKGKSASEVTPLLRELTGFKGVGKLFNTLQTDLGEAGKAARQLGAVMSVEMVRKLGMLNDQFSILSQIMLTQFAPALLFASEILLKFVSRIQGWSRFFGSATSGVSAGDVGALLNPFDKDAPDRMGKAIRKTLETGQPNKEFDDAVKGLESWLARLKEMAGKKEIPSVIGAPIDFTESKMASVRGGGFPSDANSAMKIGNFLGTGAGLIDSVASQQLAVQKRIEKNTKDAANYSRELSDSFATLLGG